MKILIIGGTSSVGRALKPILSKFSEVITAGRKNCDIELDLDDPIERITIPNDVDAVIHTAANFGGKTIEEMLETENINVLGALKICHAAVRSKTKHLVLISSIFACLEEDSEYYSIYSLSKKHSEEVSKFYCSTHSLPLAILRPSQIYGNGENFRIHQPFLYDMIDRAERGEDITIYGSNDALRNYIHVDDLVNIIAEVIKNKIEGVYSCMFPEDLTYSQIAKSAISAFKGNGGIIFLKDKPNIPNNIFEKDNSLYKKINFTPQISIEDGMKKIALYKKTLQ